MSDMDTTTSTQADPQPSDTQAEPAPAAGETAAADGKKPASAMELIRQSVSEDDPKPSPSLTLTKIIGGDILAATLVRSHIWLLVLIVVFTVVYVAFRYQCQQDLIAIDRLEAELKDTKYKALSISSELTERCRESHILDMLKASDDSLLHPSDLPPYIIEIPKQ